MNPRPDPPLVTNILFALVLACAAAPAPDAGGAGTERAMAHLHGRLPVPLRLPR